IPATAVDDVTGFPEILDGRVKTLHPKIHGGLLAKKDDANHEAQLSEHEIGHIDVVVVNLYPFKDTLRKPDATPVDIIENIDIGVQQCCVLQRKTLKMCLSLLIPLTMIQF